MRTLEELQAEHAKIMEDMGSVSMDVGAHTPIESVDFPPIAEASIYPGIPEDMGRLSESLSTEHFAAPAPVRSRWPSNALPEIPGRMPLGPLGAVTRDLSGPGVGQRGMDLSDAIPVDQSDAGLAPGDERNQGRYYPEHDSVHGIQSVTDGMRDYHQRLMDVLDSMQNLLFDGVAQLDEIQSRFNRMR